MMKSLNGLLAAFLLLGSPLWAAEIQWISDPVSGCKVRADGVDLSKDVISWSGACVDQVAEGKGVLVWFRDGRLLGRYQGGMQQGRFHGNGLLAYDNPQTAEHDYVQIQAQFKQGLIDGRTKIKKPSGDQFDGWLRTSSLRAKGSTGFGVYTSAAGEVYRGPLKDGLFEGRGELYEIDGGRMRGYFMAGEPHGKSEYHAANGDVYRINWVNGKIDGEVEIMRRDGSSDTQYWQQGVLQPSLSGSAESGHKNES
ncbi:MAG: hypothetical protein KZQ58_06685 [gamma proteobacterium symbiont of Bathyaustriella thionipta]|nr:hypothetical protein [gamma proteobacterium symbiont of Bathyaustriella thionipta]